MLTEGQPESLSQVTPFMVAALVCDAMATEPNSGKTTLIGIFDHINSLDFPTQRAVTLYFRITDAEGRYEISLKFVSPNSGEILGQTTEEVSVSDRLEAPELGWVIDPLEIPEPGRYEFQLWANSAFVGSASFVAQQMPRQTRR